MEKKKFLPIFYQFEKKNRFNNETKNYKVYYDGAFYVGEKRFDTIADLVHDGLISFYIEKHASNYIAMMAEESNYAESPYVASRTALLARQNRQSIPQKASPPQSIHSSFQKQNQQQQQQAQQNIHQQIQQHIQQQQHFHHPQHQISNTFVHQHHLAQQPIQSSSSLNQLDKENRHFNTTLELENRLQISTNSSKSNNIIDRFNIMNSEKPHRFKVFFESFRIFEKKNFYTEKFFLFFFSSLKILKGLIGVIFV